MYCKYCGHKIDEDSTYCAGCGVKLNIAVSPVNSVQPKPADNFYSYSSAKTPSDFFNSIEEYEPTFKNIIGQFSLPGKIAFILLMFLLMSSTAVLTLFTFYPNIGEFFK
jgi:predicted amidophosphoribosyltransferase